LPAKLQAGTRDAAASIGMGEELGTIEEGKGVREAPVVVGQGVLWVEADGLVIVVDGPLELAQVGVDVASSA
jgi:hypothetical protein